MILNAYALLTLFAALVELALGVAILVLAARALLRRRADPHRVDERLPLLGHLASVLLVASALSWPLLYLLLDSYVPAWRGVVCIQGVTRIGEGSVGAAGWLPTLVSILEATKPALLLAVGAWAVVRGATRAAAAAPRLGRELSALLVCGSLALVDAAASFAYVLIPKKERFLESACCAVPLRSGVRLSEGDFTTLTASTYDARALTFAWAAATLAELLAITWALRRPRWTWAALGAAGLSVLVGLPFVREVAAPAFLDLPRHRCTYCVLSSSVAGVAFLAFAAAGVLCVAWAAVAQATAGEAVALTLRDGARCRLLRAGRLATAASGVLVGVWLLLA